MTLWLFAMILMFAWKQNVNHCCFLETVIMDTTLENMTVSLKIYPVLIDSPYNMHVVFILFSILAL